MSGTEPGSLPSVPRDVVVSTRAVLLSSTKGVALKRFSVDYKKLVGKCLN